MFCSNCGKEIEETAKFCQHCGAEIGTIKNKQVLVIAITVVLACLIAIISFFSVRYVNQHETTITIKGDALNEAFSYPTNFTGSKVIVKVKPNSLFTTVNKQIMDAMKFKFESNLRNNHHNDAVVNQISKDEFLVSIPNEFDKQEIDKLFINTPMLKFKKESNNHQWENTGLSGADLKKAEVSKADNGEYIVLLYFNNTGKEKLTNLTKSLVGKSLAIFFDEELMAAPIIREALTDGIAQISGGLGGFSYDEAKLMVDMLNSDYASLNIKVKMLSK